MKTAYVLAATVAAFVVAGPASAACTTGALKGTWRMVYEGGYCDAIVSGTGTIGGSCGSGKLIMGSGCKVTGNIAGYNFEARTEAIGSKSRLKPNHIVGFGPYLGGLAGYRR